MDISNYEYSGSSSNYEAGEIVECIIIDKVFPKPYLLRLEEENKILAEKAKGFGVEFVPKQPTFKEGGIQYVCAIINKGISYANGERISEKVWKYDGTGYVVPSYIATCTLNHFPPSVQLALKSKKGTLYGDMYRNGGTNTIIKGRPSISKLLPSVNQEYNYNKDTKEFFYVDQISLGDESKYRDLLNRETRRMDEWRKLITEYNSSTDKQCETYLRNMIARRYLLCRVEDNKVNYAFPDIGMVFTAAIESSTGGYPNIRAFEYSKAANGYIYYSSLNVRTPSPDDIEEAHKIKQAWVESIERARQAKAEKESEANSHQDDDDEDAW